MTVKRFIIPVNSGGTIQNLRTTSVTSTTVVLAWNQYTGATGYQIFRNGSQVTTLSGLTNTTYTDTGRTASTLYTYAVRPVVGGVGLASAEASVNVTTPAAGETPFFTDDFETGTLPYSRNGFTWEPGSTGDGDLVEIVSGTSYTGSRSLLFRYNYAAGPGDSMAEMRFYMGRACRDLWVRYWIRIPANYYHRAATNNKGWLSIWAGDYNAPSNVALVYNFWPTGNVPSQTSYASLHMYGQGFDQQLWSAQPNAIEAADLGQWLKMVFHFKYATAPNNGVAECWKTRNGVTQKITNIQNGNWYWAGADAHAGWTTGYILGAANSGFTDTTDFYLDDFAISETELT